MSALFGGGGTDPELARIKRESLAEKRELERVQREEKRARGLGLRGRAALSSNGFVGFSKTLGSTSTLGGGSL